MAATSSATDYLGIATNPKVLKMLAGFSGGNERVIFTDKIDKINRKGKLQQRVLIITSRGVYNCKGGSFKCQRRISLEIMHSITINPIENKFVLHILNDYDYYFSSPRSGEIVQVIQTAVQTATSRLIPKENTEMTDLNKIVVTKQEAKTKGVNRSPISVASPTESKPVSSPPPSGGGAAAAAATPSVEATVFAQNTHKVKAEDFDLLKVLGKGSFGKVMLVRRKDTGEILAMKTLQKELVMAKNQVEHTKAERHTLEDVSHPFIVKMKYAFQSPQKLYLVMEFMSGGELFFHLKKDGIFSEDRARIYAAEIASALGHLHSRKIIYRDLKPENILLDSEGHIRLTDFGLAKEAMDATGRAHTFCGTPEYLAPEILLNKGHGKGVDWWSLGTLLYEMLAGLPPFYSENLNEMYKNILEAKLEFSEEIGPTAQDLLSGFLERNPDQRLGASERDIDEFKSHPFFQKIDWGKLVLREITPPFRPTVSAEDDVTNFDEEFTEERPIDSPTDPSGMDTQGKPKAAMNFDGFTYVDKSVLGRR